MTELAIDLKGVGKSYRHFELEPMDLELPHGQIMGFIGPNGAGKSTTIRILMGLVHQDRGAVRVLGRSMPGDQVAAKWDIGFASEDMRLYKHATLDWHMGFVASIYPSWDETYARHLVERFDLVPAQKLKGMSRGQQVKAGLILVLARRPKLLLLDEPTTGLDPVARTEVLGALMEVLADEERTILFSSHNTADVEQLSDTITVIDRGAILDSDDKESFLERWRRLRVVVPESVRLGELPGVVESHQSGQLAAVVTDRFGPELERTITGSGARVESVESMTLEEIFLARVQQNRGRRAA